MDFASIADLVKNHGFAIAFGVFAMVTGGWYLRRLVGGILSSNQKLTNAAIDAMKEKDKIIGNHIDHLTAAQNSTHQMLVDRTELFRGGFDKVTEAIHGQTAMMQELLNRDCPLRKLETDRK